MMNAGDKRLLFSDPDANCALDCQLANQNCIIGCSGDVTCMSNCNRSEAECISGEAFMSSDGTGVPTWEPTNKGPKIL